MDLTTTLIGLVLVACTILPLLYFHYAQKGVKKKFAKHFINMAAQNQLVVTQYDIWSNYSAIGLDTNANKLFYLKKQGDQESTMVINLSEVDKYSLIHTKRMLNEDQVIDRLALSFTLRTTKSSEKVVEFYSKDESMTHNGELQLIEKWNKVVAARIKAGKSMAMAS